jgi:hypothetical protein
MQRRLLMAVFGIVLLGAGFVGGRLYQHVKTGYHFVVRSEREFESPIGTVEWSLVTETVGMPVHDPGATMIKWRERTLYKAKRDFQEKAPLAGGNDFIDWDDGEYHYHLTIAEAGNRDSIVK